MTQSSLLSPAPPVERFTLSETGKTIKKEIEEAQDDMCEAIRSEEVPREAALDRCIKLVWTSSVCLLITGMVIASLTTYLWTLFIAVLLAFLVYFRLFKKAVESDRECKEGTQEIREQFAEHFRSIIRKHPSLISDLKTATDDGCSELAEFLEHTQKW